MPRDARRPTPAAGRCSATLRMVVVEEKGRHRLRTEIISARHVLGKCRQRSASRAGHPGPRDPATTNLAAVDRAACLLLPSHYPPPRSTRVGCEATRCPPLTLSRRRHRRRQSTHPKTRHRVESGRDARRLLRARITRCPCLHPPSPSRPHSARTSVSLRLSPANANATTAPALAGRLLGDVASPRCLARGRVRRWP